MSKQRFEPRIVGFLCNWCSYAAADTAGVSRMEQPPNVDVVRVMCTGRVEPSFVLKAFSAGADIGNIKTHRVTSVGEHLSTVTPRGMPVFNVVADYPKPVIAAINGYALGIGCLITLCCDILLASENAVMGLPQVPLGIIPAYGGAVRLARYVGRGKAMEMVLLGERITAAEAYRVGLVNRVVPLDELMPTARGIAEAICEAGPMAVRTAKEAMVRGMNMSLEEGLRLESTLIIPVMFSKDSEEGIAAFKEKRKPKFEGR